jgi:hypothetical protein
MAQGGQTTQYLLHPFQVSNRVHSVEGGDFLRIGLDAPLGNNVPSSMPRGTPKMHFSGFNFTPFTHRQSNTTCKSLTRLSAFLVLTTMSSM